MLDVYEKQIQTESQRCTDMLPFRVQMRLLSKPSGLYYKPIMIVNDDSRVINKLETGLTDNARVVIYDHHMFIVQATDRKQNNTSVACTKNM